MGDIIEKITAFIRDGHVAKAITLLQDVNFTDSRKNDFVRYFDFWGTNLQDKGMDNEAAKIYALALEKYPDEPVLLSNYGLSLLNIGDRDEAGKLLRRARRLDPKNPFYHYNIGHFHEVASEWAEARERYEASVRRDQKFSPGYLGLARSEGALGNMTASAKAYDQYLDIEPNDAKSWIAAARAHHLAGHSETAKNYLTRALEVAPDDLYVHFNRMVGSYYAKNRETVVEEVEWLKGNAADSPEYFMAACAAAILDDDLTSAIPLLWQAIRGFLGSDDVEWDRAVLALCWAMKIFAETGNDEEAQKLYEFALPSGCLPEQFLHDYRFITHPPLNHAVQVQLVVDAATAGLADSQFKLEDTQPFARYMRSYTVIASDEDEARLIAVRSEWDMNGRDVRVERVIRAQPVFNVHPGLVYVSGKVPYDDF